MSTNVEPFAINLQLPWESSVDQDEKFKRTLKRVLAPLLLLFLIIPWLPLFEKEFEETETEIVVTKILLEPIKEPEPIVEDREKIKPPKPVEKEPPKPKEIVKPEPKNALIKTAKSKSGSAKKTAVKTDKVDKKISIKSSQGLNELSSQLSALRGSVDLTRLKNKNLSDNKVGNTARSSRTVLGSDQVNRKSGGINVDGNLLKNESTTLAAHTTTAVDGLVEGGTGPSGNSAYLSSKQGQRDMESIRRTLERTKSNVYSLYQKALLERPELAGKFEFKILIEPDGSISDLKLISSELGLSDLEIKILNRIKNVNFGPEDVSVTPVIYKFVFLPS
jgi:outer membrane biosynthesis protein TonB